MISEIQHRINSFNQMRNTFNDSHNQINDDLLPDPTSLIPASFSTPSFASFN